MKKTIAFLCCVGVLLAALPLSALAAAGAPDVVPLANNVAQCTTTLSISAEGYATLRIRYIGYSGVTTGGTVTTKLQKRFLLLFWKDVEGCEWVDSSSDSSYLAEHGVWLSDTGKYRAVSTYVISGAGGADDVVEQTAEAEW